MYGEVGNKFPNINFVYNIAQNQSFAQIGIGLKYKILKFSIPFNFSYSFSIATNLSSFF